ncbi:WW domain-containing oxidoreductase [Lophiostoma macrostomum CBS 122681]|uniref:WW domain-containing oxidoreductase n=1 Tax=Lophiostoma macrostomum CBS 122681 TaxID=1314788 RepID=A0A6A6TP45_9PLEO|nr:WW domain-containing oxidoreductase [Lophiostoma macrostomum CBS 122681]
MATSYDRNATSSGVAADLASNIAGKVVLTTGVSPGGLGAQFVESIAKHKPALLILAGRSPSKVKATADKIRSENGDVETRVLALNLSSQARVREAAKEVLAYPEPAIDVVVNSAGVMGGPHKTTEEGLELNFGSNHIGHFLFTNLIMPKILAAKTPRIVNVSSSGHRLGPVRFDDYNFQDGKVYNSWEAYGQSKTANILYSKALATKLASSGLKAYSLHPGVTFGTSLAPWLTEEDLVNLKALDQRLGNAEGEDGKEFDVKTLDECAATHVVAAFDPRLDGYNGAFLEDANISSNVRPTATNSDDPEKLWKLSEKIVGQTFEF